MMTTTLARKSIERALVGLLLLRQGSMMWVGFEKLCCHLVSPLSSARRQDSTRHKLRSESSNNGPEQPRRVPLHVPHVAVDKCHTLVTALVRPARAAAQSDTVQDLRTVAHSARRLPRRAILSTTGALVSQAHRCLSEQPKRARPVDIGLAKSTRLVSTEIANHLRCQSVNLGVNTSTKMSI